jgi:hypothetical protein
VSGLKKDVDYVIDFDWGVGGYEAPDTFLTVLIDVGPKKGIKTSIVPIGDYRRPSSTKGAQ